MSYRQKYCFFMKLLFGHLLGMSPYKTAHFVGFWLVQEIEFSWETFCKTITPQPKYRRCLGLVPVVGFSVHGLYLQIILPVKTSMYCILQFRHWNDALIIVLHTMKWSFFCSTHQYGTCCMVQTWHLLLFHNRWQLLHFTAHSMLCCIFATLLIKKLTK